MLDKIVLLALQYGDSYRLGDAQKEWFKHNAVPKPIKKSHGYPCPEPEVVRKKE